MGYGCYERDGRDCGYGVPAKCDHPDCSEDIDRGLGYVCGGSNHNEEGCWRFFCGKHANEDHHENEEIYGLCERCANDEPPFDPSPDTQEWIDHKMIDPTWDLWRSENPEYVKANAASLLNT